jgi:hypothetical protein
MDMSDDAVSTMLYTFLTIEEHFCLGVSCKSFWELSCIPFPHGEMVSAAWNKAVRIRCEIKRCLCMNSSKYFKELPLRHLHLYQAFDAAVGMVSTMSSLRYLELSAGNYVTDVSMSFLKKKNISVLVLISCQITNVGLIYLKDLPLVRLDLINCPFITNDGLKHLKHLSLQHLKLRSCLNVSDEGLNNLRLMPLTHLDLGLCPKVTDSGLFHLKNLPLEYLDLRSRGTRRGITDFGLSHLSKMPLRHLCLMNCRAITDVGLLKLKELPLEYIDLMNCYHITDDAKAQMKCHVISEKRITINLLDE